MSINTNTWTEATDGLTNNERGVLYSLINARLKGARFSSDRGGQGFYYPEVKRTTDPSADLSGYRNGVRVKDAAQIGKALAGLEEKGYIITAPRTGVQPDYRRQYRYDMPVRFIYRDEEYRRWQENPKGYGVLAWDEVMHVRVPLAAQLREAIVREREQATTAEQDREYTEAKQRLDAEPQRLADFVALMDEYRAKYGDGSLPVEPASEYRRELYGDDAVQASDLLRRIENEAKSLRSWIEYKRDDMIDTVAKREAERVEVTA